MDHITTPDTISFSPSLRDNTFKIETNGPLKETLSKQDVVLQNLPEEFDLL